MLIVWGICSEVWRPLADARGSVGQRQYEILGRAAEGDEAMMAIEVLRLLILGINDQRVDGLGSRGTVYCIPMHCAPSLRPWCAMATAKRPRRATGTEG
jgi:hypothetical protein